MTQKLMMVDFRSVSICSMMVILFWINPTSVLSQSDSLPIHRILSYDSQPIADSLVRSLDPEKAYCLALMDTARGVIFIGGDIWIRMYGTWRSFFRPTDEDHTICEQDLIGHAFADINGAGREEIIITYELQYMGARGGSIHRYVEIWDLDHPAMLLSIPIYEHFSWYSDPNGGGTCKRVIEVNEGVIIIGKVNCTGDASDFDLAEDPLQGSFQWEKGSLMRSIE